MVGNFERSTILKVWQRTVPLMMTVFFFCYLDRVNISFAALRMNQALGFSNTVFGMAAGSFALGYVLFGIPSTLLLHRMGARRWMSIIMVAWGFFSVATAFVKGPAELLGIRFLLGVAEAGFTAGVVLHLSSWFPGEYRGRVVGSFFFMQPIGLVIGAPLSSALLVVDRAFGLAGWQWLFIVEGVPSILLALAVLKVMTDKPADATWLLPMQQRWLRECLAREQRRIESAEGHLSVGQTLANRRVWLLAIVALAVSTSGLGAIFFLPLMTRTLGFSTWNTGFVDSLIGIVSALTLPLWGSWSDRARARESVVAAACFTIACGLSGAAVLFPSKWAILPFAATMVGFSGCVPVLWTLAPSFLTGAGAAAGIAFVNVVGSLGQFIGPTLVGWTSDLTKSYVVGLACLAAIAAGAAALMAAQAQRKQKTRAISTPIGKPEFGG